jgi:hypothetical protein
MQIDLSNFLLLKLKEDARYVWYKFEVKIIIETGTDKKNRPIITDQTKHGVFRFDKEKPHEINALEILKDKTDQCLNEIMNRLTAKFLVKMIACKKNNDFAETIHLAYW